jgi:hypothetical protein
MATTTFKGPVILNSWEDWREWIEIIKGTADTYEVWGYIDPDKNPEEIHPLIKATEPRPRDVNPSKATLLALDGSEARPGS